MSSVTVLLWGLHSAEVLRRLAQEGSGPREPPGKTGAQVSGALLRYWLEVCNSVSAPQLVGLRSFAEQNVPEPKVLCGSLGTVEGGPCRK